MASDPQHDPAHVADAARAEARQMLAAVAGCDDDAKVRIGVAQFRTLALLIERLASDSGGCGGACMGAPIDGIRFWVPAVPLAAARALAAAHVAAALRAAGFTW